jgi:hypothetical protein
LARLSHVSSPLLEHHFCCTRHYRTRGLNGEPGFGCWQEVTHCANYLHSTQSKIGDKRDQFVR